jgi:hypothetical protein
MSLPKLNPVEPPWYGPVCPVVGEGWHREVSPYPDHQVLQHRRQQRQDAGLDQPGTEHQHGAGDEIGALQ